MIAQVYSDDNIEVYRFLSTDEKPLSCKHGSRALEIDTGRKYIFDAENSIWQEVHDSDEDRPVDAYTKEETQALLLTKVDKVSGMGLSQESYTTAEKQKLAGIEAGATAVTVDSALSSTSTNPVQNQAVYADKQKQDAALAEVENKGAKNVLDNQHLVMSSGTGVTITSNNDGTYNLSGTPTGTATYLYTTAANFSSLYGTEIGKSYTITAGSNKVLIRVDYSTNGTSWDNGEDGQPLVTNIAGVATFTIPASTVGLYIRFRSTASAGSLDGIILKPMICTKAEWDISQAYVPYGKTNAELTSDISALSTENTSQQAEINYAVNTGVKNLFPITASGTQTIGGVVFTVNSDGTITANGTKTNNDWFMLSENNSFDAGTYTLSDGLPVDTTDCLLIITTARTLGTAIMSTTANARPQTKTFNTAQTGLYYAIRISSGKTVSNLTFKPMIRPASIADPTYEPYALSNPVLTPAAIKAVDEGAKNICNWSESTSTVEHVTFTINSDKTVSTSGTATARSQKALFFTVPSTLKAGRYVLSGCPSGGEQSGTVLYCLYLWDLTANARVASGNDTGNGLEFDWIPDSSHTYNISVDVRSGTNASGLIFKPMICTAADWTVSKKFVPYAPTNRELYEEKIGIEDVYGAGTKIGANTNFNDLKTHGLYYSTSTQDIASFTNCPVSTKFTLSVKFGSQSVFQEIQPMSKAEIMYRYVRMLTEGTWSSWYKFEGTEVT